MRSNSQPRAVFAHVLQQFRGRRRRSESTVRWFSAVERRFFHVNTFCLRTHGDVMIVLQFRVLNDVNQVIKCIRVTCVYTIQVVRLHILILESILRHCKTKIYVGKITHIHLKCTTSKTVLQFDCVIAQLITPSSTNFDNS